MLKNIKIKLELFTDPDMANFVEKGIRGNFSGVTTRYAKANNKYMNDYDPSKPSTFIIYIDSNNLYGQAMSQELPYADFTWGNPEKLPRCKDELRAYIDKLRKKGKGAFFKIDLKSRKHLHDLHNDFPLCPENVKIDVKVTKLITNLNDKERYVMHYKMLMFCLDQGMELVKIHRATTFKESAWMKPYIDLNTKLRT